MEVKSILLSETINLADRMILTLADELDPNINSKQITDERIVNWYPNVGPQTEAFNSDADVIGYGGAAGGGKSDLLLGFAALKHFRSVIFRRVFPQLESIEFRSREIYNQDADSRLKDRYNESLHRWEFRTGATVRFAAMQYEDDKRNYQGRPFDFYGFDEATEFTESQVRFVIGWNRTTRENQKCRVVLTFNPPMDEESEWVVRFFAPWLDDTHPNPAKDGELRWFSTVGDREVERPNGDPFMHEGEKIYPKSRTFFHAKLSDNPHLEKTGYASTINAMPEPLRSLLRGKFGAYKKVDPFQLIPMAWVIAAQKRHADMKRPLSMTSIGVDVARGGDNKTVFAPLYQDYMDELSKFPGEITPDGRTVALLLFNRIGKDQKPTIGIDTGGPGGAVYDASITEGYSVIAINFGAGSNSTDRSGKYKFANLRSEMYWTLRELLNPDYEPTLGLPPDKELMGDLCALKWKIKNGRIYIESKEDVAKRIGRSTDCGDAAAEAVYCRNIIGDDLSDLGHLEDFKNKWS